MKYQNIRQYKYELTTTEVIDTGILGRPFTHKFFSLDGMGKLTVYPRYKWDGVSGPTWDSKNTMVPGLGHDALYQAIRLKLLPLMYKAKIDLLFKAQLLDNNMHKFRAGYYYKSVYWVGHYSCIPGDVHIPEVLEA